MSQYILRIIIAVITVVILFALIPPVLRIFGLNSNDLEVILRVAIGGLALLYVVVGHRFPLSQ